MLNKSCEGSNDVTEHDGFMKQLMFI